MPFAAYLAVLLSYLVGAVPFGYIVARLRGVDIFRAGSGNIGATNVGRVLGRKFGLLVFILDFLKGAVPTAVVRYLLPDMPWAAVAAGLVAFVGHMFPVYLRFRGGKGVATGTGVVAVLLPGPTAVAVLVWVSVLVATRYVSLASVLAAVALAVVRLLATPEPFAESERILTAFSLLAAVLVAVRHRSNLARLSRGNENRVADSPRLRMATRVLHVLALGLWFGAAVFFTFVVGPTLFHTFEAWTGQQPDWLSLREPLTSKQTTPLFGVAIGPMFPQYFAIQGACGVVALVTAWGWTRSHPDRVHRLRFWLIALALMIVLGSWPLAGVIEDLRVKRYSDDPAVSGPADAAFGRWHLMSVLVNLAVLALVAAATALAARLPAEPPAAPPAKAD
ncbi:MAG TPA: glycerol-3-phosphate 1-O-acyltransferase PlsY [Gemmataceae bacterium]|jgi:acyl-phosphate glycerol 3-phosphate acyltransferase